MTDSTRRTILVTGAASGIGAAVCRALASPGVALLLHTRRNRDGVSRVAAEVRASGATGTPPPRSSARP
jgi:NAD(P)-dependent dehydrogenase (short-subunit alcohol dehydrogenase family)